MYSEPTTENFNMIKQTLQEREQKVSYLYPYLSQNKILSQEEHKNEAIKIMERIKDQYNQQQLNRKLNEISPQEMIQEGLRFVNLANEIHILCQQDKKIFQEEDQSIQQLQHAEEQLERANKQLQQAKEQLQKVKKKLDPTQEKLRLINRQETLFNEMFKNNKSIVLQKFTAK